MWHKGTRKEVFFIVSLFHALEFYLSFAMVIPMAFILRIFVYFENCIA